MGSSRASLVSLVVCALLTSFGALTGVDAQEDEPPFVQLVNEYFLTNAVYPQEEGEIQFTSYPRIDFDEGYRAAFPLAIEFGLTDRWQIEAEWVTLVLSRPDGVPGSSGTGDFELETQYSFMNVAGSSTHIALGVGLTLPAGDRDAGGSEGVWEVEPSIALARDMRAGGRPSQLFGQLALGLVGDEATGSGGGEPAAHELFVSAGYAIAIGSASWTVELGWSTNEWDGGDESDLYVAPGLVWALPNAWELGVGIPIGLGGDASPVGLSLILLYEFELGEED